MPVHKISRAENGQVADLKKQLVAEWKAAKSKAKEPVILVDEGRADEPVHVYVIWSKWMGMDQETRSQVILDAYREVTGDDAVLLVTVAMGLTRGEADNMGIREPQAKG
jgi:hypothetical protein